MQITGQNNGTQKIPQVQYNSTYNCGTAVPANGTPTVPEPQVQQPQVQQQPQVVTQPVYPQGYYYPPNITTTPAPTSGVNIQIFNPAVMPPNGTTNVNAPVYYPSGYYTGQIGPNQPAPNPQCGQSGDQSGQQSGTTSTQNTNTQTTNITQEETTKKTKKRKIVILTDEYIKNLENYLNSQDKSIRLSAAKEVFARLEEDDSRRDDKALNALINKMLQDPAEDIRFLALTALDSRMVTGDDYTVNVLKKLRNSNRAFGQEAVDANNILLKMSGQIGEKEFEVEETKSKPKKNPLYDVK